MEDGGEIPRRIFIIWFRSEVAEGYRRKESFRIAFSNSTNPGKRTYLLSGSYKERTKTYDLDLAVVTVSIELVQGRWAEEKRIVPGKQLRELGKLGSWPYNNIDREETIQRTISVFFNDFLGLERTYGEKRLYLDRFNRKKYLQAHQKNDYDDNSDSSNKYIFHRWLQIILGCSDVNVYNWLNGEKHEHFDRKLAISLSIYLDLEFCSYHLLSIDQDMLRKSFVQENSSLCGPSDRK